MVLAPFLILRVGSAPCYPDPKREQVRFGAREGVSDELGAVIVATP